MSSTTASTTGDIRVSTPHIYPPISRSLDDLFTCAKTTIFRVHTAEVRPCRSCKCHECVGVGSLHEPRKGVSLFDFRRHINIIYYMCITLYVMALYNRGYGISTATRYQRKWNKTERKTEKCKKNGLARTSIYKTWYDGDWMNMMKPKDVGNHHTEP